MNTGMIMKNPAQLIAEAIDAAMQMMIVKGRPISQSELSRRSGVPQATISRTLSGSSIPETNTLSRLIAVLGEDNVHIPPEVMMLVPRKPLSEQDRIDAFLLHKISTLEAVLHILVSSDQELFAAAEKAFNLYAEARIANNLHSSSTGDEENSIHADAIESTRNAVFWKPDQEH